MTGATTRAGSDSVRLQIDRILRSECFRGSETMRTLLQFLGDKLLSGEADQLKEYSIGIDALGKPSSYDPRSDSTVRVQIGRLRQKLAEYYRTEGAHDILIVDIPKGQLSLDHKAAPVEEVALPDMAVSGFSERQAAAKWLRRTQIAAGVAVAALVLSAVLAVELWRQPQPRPKYETGWTPELEELWAPFLTPGKPVNISFEAPMFIRMGPSQFFRDTSVNRLSSAVLSPAVTAVGKALQVTQIEPRYHYAPFQEVNSAFLLGKLLAGRKPQTFLVRNNQLSWEQMANNNWLFIGSSGFFAELVEGSHIERQFIVEQNAVRNVHPRPGEPPMFMEQHSVGTASPLGFSEDGEVYAVVTRAPGPSANSNILYFESNVTSARLGAVQWFTDPELAATLVAKLKGPSDKLPRYFQVVIRVKYRDAIPIQSAYVTHRELPAAAGK